MKDETKLKLVALGGECKRRVAVAAEHDWDAVSLDALLIVWCFYRWEETGKGVYADLALIYWSGLDLPVGFLLQEYLTRAALKRLHAGKAGQGSHDAARKELRMFRAMVNLAYQKSRHPEKSLEDCARDYRDYQEDEYDLPSADTLADYWKRRLTPKQKAALIQYWDSARPGEPEPDPLILLNAVLAPR